MKKTCISLIRELGGQVVQLALQATHSVFYDKERVVTRTGPFPQYFVHYKMITDSYFYVIRMEEENYLMKSS